MGVWTERMRGQLDGLNSDLLATIDRITERRPDAAIVLFSDHGARYSLRERGDEWHATFLAARTPGHPRLFDEEAEPSAVLRLMTDTYRLSRPCVRTSCLVNEPLTAALPACPRPVLRAKPCPAAH